MGKQRKEILNSTVFRVVTKNVKTFNVFFEFNLISSSKKLSNKQLFLFQLVLKNLRKLQIKNFFRHFFCPFSLLNFLSFQFNFPSSLLHSNIIHKRLMFYVLAFLQLFFLFASRLVLFAAKRRRKLKQFVVKHVNGRMYGIKMRSQGRCCVIGRYCWGLLWTDSYHPRLLHIWYNVIRHLNC